MCIQTIVYHRITALSREKFWPFRFTIINLRAALLDVETWSKERFFNGLCAMISPHYTTTGTWRSRPEAIVPEASEFRRQIGEQVELRVGAYCYNTDAKHIEAVFRQSEEVGADELILFESTPLQMSGHGMGGGVWPKWSRNTGHDKSNSSPEVPPGSLLNSLKDFTFHRWLSIIRVSHNSRLYGLAR